MDLLRVATVGTYPPTQCGIATFGAALRSAMAPGLDLPASPVIRTVDAGDTSPSRPEVSIEWHPGDPDAVTRIVEITSACDALIVQHEFGIYDGFDGAAVVDLVARATVPVVVVLHTVPAAPSATQRAIIEALGQLADVLVTLTDAARRRLVRDYAVGTARVEVILHGATPNFPTFDEERRRRRADRPTLLTWGLIGPGKGLEHAIDAIAVLHELGHQPRYVIAGETHPKVRQHHGESYRESLVARAADRGVERFVEFDDRYRSLEELAALVRSADLVVLPYESREQVTSGVLVEALASAKPVVATEFPHAREALAGGAGLTVPHEDPHALAHALHALLVDPTAIAAARAIAQRDGAAMFWPTIGRQYLTLARSVVDAHEQGTSFAIAVGR